MKGHEHVASLFSLVILTGSFWDGLLAQVKLHTVKAETALSIWKGLIFFRSKSCSSKLGDDWESETLSLLLGVSWVELV